MEIVSPLMVTIPHSGERIPSQAPWLNSLPEPVLMCDVDRYVDVLYEPALRDLQVPFVKTEWHRYAADLNRLPEDVDCTSVVGHSNPAGSFNRGFHWVVTTHKDQLMPQPMSVADHQQLVDLVYKPFHHEVKEVYRRLHESGFKTTFHIDAHSMPSLGTDMHRDPGEQRADIVVSDSLGKSCDPRFKDLVIAAYATAGFKVAYNWPYYGGRLTEQYGDPARGQHTLQVEMNRHLYMDEVSKKLKSDQSEGIQKKVAEALRYILLHLPRVMQDVEGQKP